MTARLDLDRGTLQLRDAGRKDAWHTVQGLRVPFTKDREM